MKAHAIMIAPTALEQGPSEVAKQTSRKQSASRWRLGLRLTEVLQDPRQQG
jgi:hypothetical protein